MKIQSHDHLVYDRTADHTYLHTVAFFTPGEPTIFQRALRCIQFNLVVSTNKTAVNLWKKYGFSIIGTIPHGFKHMQLGYVDAFIMYREMP